MPSIQVSNDLRLIVYDLASSKAIDLISHEDSSSEDDCRGKVTINIDELPRLIGALSVLAKELEK